MKLSRKTLKVGTFTLITSAIVLAIVIALNLFVSVLPDSVKVIDTTKEKIYTIGDDTKALLSSVDDEVEMYLLVETGKENEITGNVEGLIGQYTSECSKISYKRIDPVLNPNFSGKYTEETPSANSVIVVCGEKSRVIDGATWRMYETDQGRLTSAQYESYASMYSMYGQSFSATELFMGETNLTGALSYVTSDVTSKVYFLTGHGEQEIDSNFKAILDDANVESDSLNLLTGDGAIPDDCTMIFINYPSADISADETEKLFAFHENGGHIFLTTYVEYYQNEAEPNLASLAAKAGMKSVDGMVFDGDYSHFQSYQYNIMPSLSDMCPAELATDSALTYFLPYSHGIVEAGGTASTFMPILVTSSDSYIKHDIYNVQSLEKEEGDTDGPFNAAAVSTLDNGATFTWFASPSFTDSRADYGGNSALFKAIIKWTCTGEESVSVSPKVMSSEDLVLNENQINLWRTVMEAIIPLAVLAAGFAVWFSRRRKR
ncbi:MAG: Gldg family protein [Clostridia bacterium]|nr:Gldg family protein [Clostridia bacterium]